MVTGVYDPEASGASLQCRQLIAGLQDEIDFAVLTTSFDRTLPQRSIVDGVNVRRVFVEPARPHTKIGALGALTRAFLDSGRRADVVHFHGFSQKTILLMGLARLFGQRTVLKLTSFGHDDAIAMKKKGGLSYSLYRRADRVIAVSPRLERAWQEAGLDPQRVVFIPNAVDTARFRPSLPGERESLKRKLGWDPEKPAILFVGFFSHEKRPDVLYRAWASLFEQGLQSSLVLVGVTRSAYYEIDAGMAIRIRDDASRRGLAPHLVFVEKAAEIAEYYRAADVFALPTTREGLPNVLLEAMASGIPPVISRLAGITDWIVEDGVTGYLAPTDDEAAFATALQTLLADPSLRARQGEAARAYVERHFTPASTAQRTLALYRELLKTVRPVPA